MSVNRPTNVKQKEADVNQKLQLYGIYSGMSALWAAAIRTVVAVLRRGMQTIEVA